jgi:hypothetical protein
MKALCIAPQDLVGSPKLPTLQLDSRMTGGAFTTFSMRSPSYYWVRLTLEKSDTSVHALLG